MPKRLEERMNFFRQTSQTSSAVSDLTFISRSDAIIYNEINVTTPYLETAMARRKTAAKRTTDGDLGSYFYL